MNKKTELVLVPRKLLIAVEKERQRLYLSGKLTENHKARAIWKLGNTNFQPVKGLVEMMYALKRDLLERAETDFDGRKVVDVSTGIWMKFKKILINLETGGGHHEQE